MSRRSRRSLLLRLTAALPLAASVACADRPPAAPSQPAPPDTLLPWFDLRVVPESDSTARIEGTISDDGLVVLAEWGAARPDGLADTRDTLEITPARVVPVRFQLPVRPWGRYRVGMAARDAAGHLGFWEGTWQAGPRTLRIDALELLPASDTLRHPGLEFTPIVSGPAAIREMYVLVDAGTAAERRLPVPAARFARPPLPYQQPRRVGVTVPPVLANGPHRLTLVVVDSAGGTADTTLRYVVRVPEVPYRVRFLRGPVGDGRARDLNEAGDVAGDAPDAAGTTRAVVWRAGTLRPLPADAGPSTAPRM